MKNPLKTEEGKDLSKGQVFKIIREYLTECKGVCQKDNLNDEDFNSPAWAYKQAQNNGMIKMINKLENFLPNKEIS